MRTFAVIAGFQYDDDYSDDNTTKLMEVSDFMIIFLCALGMIVCFYLLSIVCEDHFVASLETISKKLKLSEDVAGATFMAIGSSAPELFTALIALTKVDNENIGAGTIVGSAIFNVLVIIGVSSLVATAYLDWRPVLRDLLFYIGSILILLLTFSDGQITLIEVFVYLGGYVIYLLLLSQWSKWFRKDSTESEQDSTLEEEVDEPASLGFLQKMDAFVKRLVGFVFPSPRYYIIIFAISILLIGVLSWCLVELAIILAHELGIPEVIVALTVLAAGTSVPDMLSSIIVAKKGKGDMAVSNAVGSNTFDILIGLGFPWLLYILVTGKQFVVSTENLLSSIFLLFSTVVALLVLLLVRRFKIGRWSGLFLILLYAGYLAYAIFAAFNKDPIGFEAWANSFWNLS